MLYIFLHLDNSGFVSSLSCASLSELQENKMCPSLDIMESEIKILFDLPGEFILQHLVPLHLLLLSLVVG